MSKQPPADYWFGSATGNAVHCPNCAALSNEVLRLRDELERALLAATPSSEKEAETVPAKETAVDASPRAGAGDSGVQSGKPSESRADYLRRRAGK